MSNPLLLKNSTQASSPDNTVQPSSTPSLDYTTFAQNWTQTPAISANWSAIGSSANGQYISACINPGAIYVSNNYGATWTAITTSNGVSNNSLAWTGIALSASGQYQVATIASGLIYRSVNWGVTWASTASSLAWTAVAMSSSGVYATATVSTGLLWYSTDYGATWASTASSLTWSAITMSATGQYQVATVNAGALYYSSNYGSTWTASVSAGTTSVAWAAVGMSSSGQYVTAVAGPNVLSSSSDYGKTWTNQSATFAWQAVAVSSSGQYQIVCGGTGGTGVIYYSTNYGTTWTTSTNTYNVKCATLSQTGQYAMVAVNGGLVYCATTRSPGLFTSGSIIANTAYVAGINCIGTGAVTAAPTLGSIANAAVVITSSSSTASTLSGNAYGLIILPSGNGTVHLQSQSISGGGTNAYNMTLNAMGGNVGIGITAPAYKLDVNGNINASGAIYAGKNGVAGSSSLIISSPTFPLNNAATQIILSDSANSSRMSLLLGSYYTSDTTSFGSVQASLNNVGPLILALNPAGGNVGIGVTTPSYALHVIGAIYASGDITALSDQRHKQNITPLSESLTALTKLSGYSYTRTDYKPGEKQIGLIAQEVKEVYPEAVSYDETNDTYSLNYGCLIAPIIQAMKELKEKIAQQDATIQLLLNRV